MQINLYHAKQRANYSLSTKTYWPLLWLIMDPDLWPDDKLLFIIMFQYKKSVTPGRFCECRNSKKRIMSGNWKSCKVHISPFLLKKVRFHPQNFFPTSTWLIFKVELSIPIYFNGKYIGNWARFACSIPMLMSSFRCTHLQVLYCTVGCGQ